MKNDISFPCMEPTQCYFSSDSQEGRLTMSRSGAVSLSKNRKEFERWHITPDVDGAAVIRSVAHGFALGVLADGTVGTGDGVGPLQTWRVEREGATCRLVHVASRLQVAASHGGISLGEERDATLWTMELLSGELCVLCNADFGKCVSCGPFGGLKMAQDPGGWEAWRLIESGDFSGELIIASWTHEKKVLSSNPVGEICTTENKRGVWERWTVRKGKRGVVIASVAFPERILSYNGTSLCTVSAASDGTAGTSWKLDPANANTFYITSPSRQKRMSSKADCSVFSVAHQKSWEEWKVEKGKGGFVISSCAHNKYLAVFSSGVVATSTAATPEEAPHLWDIEESAHGGVHFISQEHNYALCCDEEGRICTTAADQAGAAETCRVLFGGRGHFDRSHA